MAPKNAHGLQSNARKATVITRIVIRVKLSVLKRFKGQGNVSCNRAKLNRFWHCIIFYDVVSTSGAQYP
jgi:hypothetical protein